MNSLMDIQSISDTFLLQGNLCRDVSLFYGKMGIATFFFLLSRHTGNVWYEEFAGELLEDVCTGLSSSLPVTFADGLCGIGWCIEFLKKENFVEGDTDEILCEIDARVMERDLRRISDDSLETGIRGIAAYVNSRMTSERTGSYVPFDLSYLDELQVACRRAGIDFPSDAFEVSSIWRHILDLFAHTRFTENNSWMQGLLFLNKKQYG